MTEKHPHTLEQFKTQQDYLSKILSERRILLGNINRLEKVYSEGLEGQQWRTTALRNAKIDRAAALANGSIQRREKALFDIGERIKVQEEKRSIVQKPKDLRLAPDTITSANHIIDLIPTRDVSFWLERGDLTTEEYQRQVLQFVSYAQTVIRGEVEPIGALTIVDTPDQKKHQIAKGKIRELLVPLTDPKVEIEQFRYRWHRDIRKLLDWLGKGAREHFIHALDNLSDVERALALSNCSVALAEDLGYIDLDTCPEERYAAYIRNATFDPQDVRDGNFETLIATAVERDSEGNLDLGRVIASLCQPPYAGLIINRLIESARYLRFRDHLTIFLKSHSDTAPFARHIEAEDDEEDLPSRRRLS